MTAQFKLDNPFLDALKQIPIASGMMMHGEQYKSYEIGRFSDFKDYRKDLVKQYAWAIPSNRAIKKIAEFTNKICEIGAGTGYWAYLLNQLGVSIVAYDLAVPGIHDNKWGHKKTWFDVKHGDVLSINQHQERALMLCWPPYCNTMAEVVLNLYTGNKVIYIGEGSYGCTATDRFHELLDKNFKLVEEIDIPQWDGLHDSVYLMERGNNGIN